MVYHNAKNLQILSRDEKIRSNIFLFLLTDRQTDRQTHRQRQRLTIIDLVAERVGCGCLLQNAFQMPVPCRTNYAEWQTLYVRRRASSLVAWVDGCAPQPGM